MTGADRNLGRITTTRAIRGCSAAILLGAATLTGALTGALAQAADGEQTAGSADKLEEIIVTASKTGAHSVQDIPLNISAVTSDTIERSNAVGISDLSRLVPGLSVTTARPGDQTIAIRGLRSATAQTNVYVDEVLTPAAGGNLGQIDFELVDLERVEVLRGPQGTLYGGGSQGGTVRYITRKPDVSAFDASVAVSYGLRSRGESDSSLLTAMVNVPLAADVLAVRAVGYRRDVGGYVDIPSLGLANVGDRETGGGRLSARLLLGEDTTLTAMSLYDSTEYDDDTLVLPEADVRHVGSTPLTPANILQPTENVLKINSLTLDHESDFGMLTATASHFERDTLRTQNQTSRVPVAFRPLIPLLLLEQPGATEQWTGEVRFASALEGPLQFIGGVFYSDGENRFFNRPRMVDPATGRSIDNPASGLPPPLRGRPFLALQERLGEQTERAVFLNGAYDLTDELTFEAGVRFYRLATRNVNTTLFNPAGLFGMPAVGEGVDPASVPGAVSPTLRSKVNDRVWRFNLHYALSDDTLLYLTYAEGFRPGGGNDFASALVDPNGVGTPPDVAAQYDSDSVENYEFGWKSAWLEQRLLLNGVVYFMQWQGIQNVVRLVGSSSGFIDNAGGAELYGVEIDGRWQPAALSGFTVGFSARWSDQHLTEDSPTAGPPVNDPFAGRAGQQLQYANHYSASVNLQQTFPLGPSYQGYVRTDASYSSVAHTDYSRASPNDREIPSYVLMNARIGVESDHWELALYGSNLTNRRAPSSWAFEIPTYDPASNPFGTTGLPDRIITTAPRELGLAISYHF